MRKIILMTLLAVVSGNAMAEWIVVSRSLDNTGIIYANPSTIRKNGNIVTMWSLFDFKKSIASPDGKTYLSTKQQYEYDCEKEKSRIIAFLVHSESMGGGSVIFSNSDIQKWDPVPPDTSEAFLWKYACGIK